MTLKNVARMNPGNGKTSYANNSSFQKAVMSETLPVLDETLKDLLSTTAADGLWKCLKIVDFGCSSGPNTIFIICHIIDTIQQYYCDTPEFEVFLNDLSDNDFNNLFKLLPSFSNDQANGKTARRCFFYGLPGSFYERLLPTNTIHFAYSSYSLHWLSQIPEGLKRKNKENIYMGRTSPPEVLEAYAKQYQRDFSTFLNARGNEMIAGGRMVLTFLGRSVEDPSSKDSAAQLTLLSQTLLDMVAEGLLKMDDLYSFNVPIYMPYKKEVETVIQNDGSFNLEKMQVFQVPWDARGHDEEEVFYDVYRRGKVVADCVRAFMEPMLTSHFGSSINVDKVFERYAEKVATHLSKEEGSCFNLLISLTRK